MRTPSTAPDTATLHITRPFHFPAPAGLSEANRDIYARRCLPHLQSVLLQVDEWPLPHEQVATITAPEWCRIMQDQAADDAARAAHPDMPEVTATFKAERWWPDEDGDDLEVVDSRSFVIPARVVPEHLESLIDNDPSGLDWLGEETAMTAEHPGPYDVQLPPEAVEALTAWAHAQKVL